MVVTFHWGPSNKSFAGVMSKPLVCEVKIIVKIVIFLFVYGTAIDFLKNKEDAFIGKKKWAKILILGIKVPLAKISHSD